MSNVEQEIKRLQLLKETTEDREKLRHIGEEIKRLNRQYNRKAFIDYIPVPSDGFIGTAMWLIIAFLLMLFAASFFSSNNTYTPCPTETGIVLEKQSYGCGKGSTCYKIIVKDNAAGNVCVVDASRGMYEYFQEGETVRDLRKMR